MARFYAALSAIPTIVAFFSRLAPAAATSLTLLETRQDDLNSDAGFPRCYLNRRCPGLWPSVDPQTPPALNATLFNAINDAALLAEAALSAIPAPHFDYFFERNVTVVQFLTTVFTNVAACSEGKTCPFSLVFAILDPSRAGGCNNFPDAYSYAPAGATSTASQGGGMSFLCPKGLALPRNPSPCTTDGTPTVSLGFALLRALVQELAITDPDNSGTLFDGLTISSITEMNNYGDWDLKALGWGTAGDGLMGEGVGNAANLAYFATLSWDLGYGPAPWTGQKCQSRWTAFAATEGLVPIS